MDKLSKKIEELIIKKVSVYITSLENMHLLETVHAYIENNKDKFTARTWDCNIKTSAAMYKNILYDVEEFNYLTMNLEKIIKNFLYKTSGKYAPFMIFNSWINILGEHGYQEPHCHGNCGCGILYLTENNSAIEFIVFPEDLRKKIIPKKGDVILFDGGTHHRVVESKKERISLAFNFKVE